MKKLFLSALTACGILSAQAAQFQYVVTLNGPNEPTPSLGIGAGTVNYDDVAHTLELQVSFSGLTGTTTASHIHAPTTSPFSGTAG
ncbi:MAG TPA: CHRD domain-containing protein, partial [Candidatus Dormibacteraeota bacterium]|nr:CHRD domain-containing protein [Candidatus Dormibacteraeota bacterium]